MKRLLEALFIKDKLIDKSIFKSLYYSYDDESFVGLDMNIINSHKIYNSYEIIKERHKLLSEMHHENIMFLNVGNKTLFLRAISDYNGMFYDILIYSVHNDDEYQKYDKIFFTKEIEAPEELKKTGKPVLAIIDNHIVIIANPDDFIKHLGYQDWDYSNKCENRIDASTTEKIINDFNGADFINSYIFKKNSDVGNIKLTLDIKYINGFYIINEIKG